MFNFCDDIECFLWKYSNISFSFEKQQFDSELDVDSIFLCNILKKLDITILCRLGFTLFYKFLENFLVERVKLCMGKSGGGLLQNSLYFIEK